MYPVHRTSTHSAQNQPPSSGANRNSFLRSIGNLAVTIFTFGFVRDAFTVKPKMENNFEWQKNNEGLTDEQIYFNNKVVLAALRSFDKPNHSKIYQIVLHQAELIRSNPIFLDKDRLLDVKQEIDEANSSDSGKLTRLLEEKKILEDKIAMHNMSKKPVKIRPTGPLPPTPKKELYRELPPTRVPPKPPMP